MAAASPSPIALDYLIILDLEAHCDDPTDPHRPEIVEFPWVVFDLAHASVLDHKQIFITPRWNSNPNPPNDSLPNLSNDVVFSPSLADALMQFDAYCYNSFVTFQKSFCLLTDGHWDLSYYLFLEAARKAVVLSPHFRIFFNLRTEFCRRYPDAPPPPDRAAMFHFLNAAPPVAASGIDQCVALAAIVSRLLRDGHRFTHPEHISELEWGALSSRVLPVASAVAPSAPVGAVIRLRGLPYSCNEADVERFLAGIAIVPGGVHLVRSAQGRATGDAFVQLEYADGVAQALARDRLSVGRRYIEVFKSSAVEMATNLGREGSRVGGGRGGGSAKGKRAARNGVCTACGAGLAAGASSRPVVRVSGLQPDADEAVVRDALAGADIVGDVLVRRHADGACTGDAVVEMASDAAARKAIAARPSSTGDDSPTSTAVLVVRCCVAGLSAARRERQRFVLRVRNVVEDAEAKDVVRLFDGIALDEDDVCFVRGGSDGTERMARVTLRTRAVRDRALRAVAALRERAAGEGESGGGDGGGATEQSAADTGGAASYDDDGADAAGASDAPDGTAPASASQSVSVSTPMSTPASTSVSPVRQIWHGRALRIDDCSTGGGGASGNGAGSGGGGGGGSGGGGDGPTPGVPPGAPWDVSAGANGGGSRVVRLRGLPYTSGESDIKQFFDGFSIADGGIWRGKDRHGRASGEACVTFVSAEDAREAVAKLDKAHMGSRYIELRF